MKLRNKSVLITAGPTWVKIDNVRVISNTASGETGILLAKAFSRLNSRVTLFLGPANAHVSGHNIKVKHFRFFDELNCMVKRELKRKKYDLVVHSAAVSDYRPCLTFSKKVESGLKDLNIKFKPTSKIINLFKNIQPNIFLVAFKYEPEAKTDYLIKEAVNLIKHAEADLVVANTIKQKRYLSLLVTSNKCSKVFKRKNSVVRGIIREIKDYNA